MNAITMIASFLMGNWKLFLFGGIAVFAYFKVTSWVEDYADTVNQREQQMLQLTQARDRAIIEAQSAQAALEEIRKNEERLELLLKDAIQRQDQIRAEARAQQEVFRGHNLQTLADAKPGLIERLANKATQERFDELEKAFQ